MIGVRNTLLSPPIDVDALTHRRVVVAAGGTYSQSRLQLNSRLIIRLKANGIWPLLDRLWLFTGENATQALLDIKGLTTATLGGSPVFTASRGYKGDGVATYVNLSVKVSALTKFVQDSGHISHFVQTYDISVGTGSVVTATVDGGSGWSTLLSGPQSDTTVQASINSGAGTVASAATGGGAGFYLDDRISSASIVVARNGVDISTLAQASQGVPSGNNILTLARNNGGVVDSFCASRVASVSLGASLGTSGRPALAAAVTAYMQSVGAA